MTCECRALLDRYWQKKNLPQCNFALHKSHVDCPGIEPVLHGDRPVTRPHASLYGQKSEIVWCQVPCGLKLCGVKYPVDWNSDTASRTFNSVDRPDQNRRPPIPANYRLWFLHYPASNSIPSVTLGMGPACSSSSILDDPLLGSRAAGQGAVIIGVSCTRRCVPVQSAAHLSNSYVQTAGSRDRQIH
jgi:hypothetical protein